MKAPVGVLASKAELVSDGSYSDLVQWLAYNTRARFFANLFIVDPIPEGSDTRVAALLEDLRDAHDRAVDVRLLIGGSRANLEIEDAVESAYIHCRYLGVPCRVAAHAETRSNHRKVVVADHYVLLGSHNWSPGAFSGQAQDSLLIEDPRVAAYFAEQIARDWMSTPEELTDAKV